MKHRTSCNQVLNSLAEQSMLMRTNSYQLCEEEEICLMRRQMKLHHIQRVTDDSKAMIFKMFLNSRNLSPSELFCVRPIRRSNKRSCSACSGPRWPQRQLRAAGSEEYLQENDKLSFQGRLLLLHGVSSAGLRNLALLLRNSTQRGHEFENVICQKIWKSVSPLCSISVYKQNTQRH